MEQLSVDQGSQLNALLSDEVVMQWLMDLESEHADADEGRDSEGASRH